MSRAIEFRGLTVDGDFVYGFYVQDAYDGTSRNVAHGIQSAGCYPVEIDPKTLGQFTGLHDCNGVKIFEGDTVEDEEHFLSAIYWDANGLMFCATDVGELIDMCAPIKVIGNIHQNSELLK